MKQRKKRFFPGCHSLIPVLTAVILTLAAVPVLLSGAHAETGLPGSGLHEKGAQDGQRYEQLRYNMVNSQIVARGVTDEYTLQAMGNVPRHEFVRSFHQRVAYSDQPIPIGHGQTISQPFIVAYMTELIKPREGMKVLEIGTGSGYQAAVLAEITDQVYTIEIIEELGRWGEENLRRAGYDAVNVKYADGYHGWKDHAPFDAIVVTAAADHIPPPLVEQLRDGGRMVIPVGSPFRTQMLMLIEKRGEQLRTRSLMPVRFVPFTRQEEDEEDPFYHLYDDDE